MRFLHPAAFLSAALISFAAAGLVFATPYIVVPLAVDLNPFALSLVALACAEIVLAGIGVFRFFGGSHHAGWRWVGASYVAFLLVLAFSLLAPVLIR